MRDPPGLGLEPLSPALAGDFFTTDLPEKPSHLVLISRGWRKRCYLLAPMAPHSSTFAWKIPWTEEPGRLQSMGSLDSDVTQCLHFHFSLSCIGEGNGNLLQCSCLENPRDGEAGGLPSMGSHRVRHDWSDLAAAATYHQLCSFGCINFCCLYESSSFALQLYLM